MTRDRRSDVLKHLVQERIRTFSRIERLFYLSLVVTGLIMAISVVYMQIRHQQLQQEITSLNHDINAKQDELNDVKQEINELTRLDRITEIVDKADIKTQSGNLQKVD